MESKIIKVSIILIFMMFSAGLFNFCFAYNVTDIETIKLYVSNTQTALFQFGKGNDLPEVTAANMSEANIAGTVYSSEAMYNYYSNSSYFYYVAFNNLYLGFCRTGYYPFNCTGTTSYFDNGGDHTNLMIKYKWDATNNIWKYDGRSNGFNNTMISDYVFCGGNAEFLYYATSSRDVISKYTFINEPTEEEIRQQFDFKINIDFQKKLDNDTYIDRTSGNCALVTHSLVGWEDYYDVEVSITNSQTGVWNLWSRRWYLDYYDKDNNLLQEKMYIKGEGNTNWYTFNLKEGDYFTIFTKDDVYNVCILFYKIYDKQGNLLASRKVSFIFDSDYDPIRETLSGTIFTDEYKDSER